MKKSFAEEFPHLLVEWDYEKNGVLSPYDVPPKGRKIIWWKCASGHSYSAQVSHKAEGKRCTECHIFSNSITIQKPEVLQYWNYEMNTVSPAQVTYGSKKLFYWTCIQGHTFKTTVRAMTRKVGKGCPYCRGLRIDDTNSLAALFPTIAAEWVSCIENSNITPETITAGSHKKVKWRCSKGHEWTTSPKHRISGNTGCGVCKSGRRISKQSATLFFYLHKLFEDTILEYPLKGSRMSLDIYIPSQQVAIEYDGGFFHRDTKRDIKKDRWLLEKMPGVTLIRIREPECGNYSSVNERVLKYHLADQKNETFTHCIEGIFQDVFQCCQPVDLVKDNTDILKLMDRTEVKQSLGALFPALAEEWDTVKNKGLTPFQFRAASHEQVHWICKEEHSWKASIASRSHGRNNCPSCGSRRISTENNLAVKFPNVIKDWHPTKNKKKPNEYFPASHLSAWWLCSHCQHEWKSRIYNRTLNNSKCPKCLT